MQGVTDALIQLVKQSADNDSSWPKAHEGLHQKHRDTAKTLLGSSCGPMEQMLDREFASLREVLNAQSRMGGLSKDLLDLVSGLGEVWSSQLVDAAFKARGKPSEWLDAREALLVDVGELGAMVRWGESQKKLAAKLPAFGARTVVTGFVARTA